MRDIPFFQTENGVASLILKEVAYKKIAYIRIQSAMKLDSLLSDCIGFCKAVGAEHIYAAGHDELRQYPLFTSIIEMSCNKGNIPRLDLKLVPTDTDNYEQWRRIYNNAMHDIANAATITLQDVEKHMPGSYFVYNLDELIGIGKITDNRIDAIASVMKGAGRMTLSALASLIREENVLVEVASNNVPAMRLYESMGFRIIREISRWYQVL